MGKKPQEGNHVWFSWAATSQPSAQQQNMYMMSDALANWSSNIILSAMSGYASSGLTSSMTMVRGLSGIVGKQTSTTTINGIKSVGAAARNLNNIKMVSNQMLKKAGIDAHVLKTEFLGPKNISRFDLFRHTETGEILIMQKGGIGEAIFTGIFL